MPTTGKTLLAALALSVLANAALMIVVYERSTDLRTAQDEVKARMAERDFLLNLTPQLKPRLSKTDLAKILRRQYPGEAVNELGDHVQWRQFQFWFDTAGQLEAVRWSS
jgi:hypothetical protein